MALEEMDGMIVDHLDQLREFRELTWSVIEYVQKHCPHRRLLMHVGVLQAQYLCTACGAYHVGTLEDMPWPDETREMLPCNSTGLLHHKKHFEV